MTDDDRRTDRAPEAEVYRPPTGESARYGDGDEGMTVFQIFNLLLRHRWKVLSVPVVVTAGILYFHVTAPVTYTSRAAVMPETGGGGGGQASRLSGVASRFGIDIPTGQGGGWSLQFYGTLLGSTWFLEDAVTAPYRRGSRADTDGRPPGGEGGAEEGFGGEGAKAAGADTAARSLVELYGIRASSRPVAVRAAAGRLREHLTVQVNSETGLLEFAVTTPWPAVSQQVAVRLVELMNRFNNETRQSQASAQARFVRERLQEAEAELRAAEDSLEEFLMQNVGWQQSPELRFQQQRLQRRVELKQQVYISLATRYEESRIAEVQSTPVLTTVRAPRLPLGPDRNPLQLKVVLGLLVSGTIGVGWALGSEFVTRFRRENRDDYREFVSLREDATEELKEVGRTIRRLAGSAGARD